MSSHLRCWSWLLILGLQAGALRAQEPYRQPPEIVRRILDAPPLPVLIPAPDARRAVFAEPNGMPTIADLAQPLLRLAGRRLNPQTNGPYLRSWFTRLTIKEFATGAERPVAMPGSAPLSRPQWSPDGRWLAFTRTTEQGVELWVADPATGQARAVTTARLNATLGTPCAWLPNATELVCRLVPADRGAAPVPPRVPVGPIVQRNQGKAAPVRTYEDLLASPYDEQLFEYYATSQLARVPLAGGPPVSLGQPAIFLESDPSPDGQYLLVWRVVRPFSYQVPVERFPRQWEVWALDGRKVATIASLPSAEHAPADGVPTGPRSVQWIAGRPASLFYVEALDSGDNRRPAAVRDRAVMLDPPFDRPVELAQLGFRYRGVQWGQGGLALLSELDRRSRRTRTWVLDLAQPGRAGRLLFDRSAEDRYGDPGSPLTRQDSTGHEVLWRSPDGKRIYLAGAGASPAGERPFLDQLDLETKRTVRLWQSADTVYETVVALLDNQARSVVTRSESRSTPPNYLLRDLRRQRAASLTQRENPAPELTGVRRELVTYQRADGVKLSGTLYYPLGYREDTKVPVVFWVYPREFASADAASQVVGSPNRFVLPTGASHLFLLTQGYAVLDNPTLPVIGGDTANNTYVEQTVAGAKAAIEYLLARGIADGNFGVGGHSYGAFTTANLLAHSDLFKAGVARSGAYNRTLTPFGFQNEPRTFWEAKEVYLRMMPFAYADSINEPVLLMHGMNDDNSGTFPIQSERMYHALKGLGATVEYVQLPLEAHGYAARETVMDVVARMIEWFDRYLKPKGAPASP